RMARGTRGAVGDFRPRLSPTGEGKRRLSRLLPQQHAYWRAEQAAPRFTSGQAPPGWRHRNTAGDSLELCLVPEPPDATGLVRRGRSAGAIDPQGQTGNSRTHV